MTAGNNGASAQIRSFVERKFPAARRRALSDDTLLLESGIIDSLGMLDVVAFLEETFSIRVDDEDLSPDNFANLHSLVSFVEGKRRQIEVSPR